MTTTTRQTPIIVGIALIIGSTILWINVSRLSPNSSMDKTITVQWEGKSSLVPNIYTFSISANETGATTKIVNDELATKIDQAKKILKDNNIEDKDIQSNNIDIAANREYTNTSSRENGYRGTHTLNIKIRDIANAGKIIDQLTSIDGLLVNGGSYDNDNDESTLETARKNAFENAQKKAEDLAQLAGMKLGKPVSIDENIMNSYQPMYKMAMDASIGGAESTPSTVINPWEQEMSIQLNVVFEIR